MKRMPKRGEAVAWTTPQGETKGHVERVVTHTTKVKGHVAKATPEEPQVLVNADGSHKQAVHRPGALHRP